MVYLNTIDSNHGACLLLIGCQIRKCQVALCAHKIKDLLVDLALGMTPFKKWDGSYKVNAGHLIVNKQGQVVCLLFDDRDIFREYLFLNTKFDRGSKSRHNYGGIRRDGAGVFLDLNLQIRFIK